MKQILLFYAMLMMLLSGGLRANAKVINETNHFFCGFDEQSEFDQWTTVDLNGEFNQKNVYRWDEDSRSAYYSSGATNDGDDWLISPAVHLSGGKSFVFKVNMFCDWSCKLTFAMGRTNTADGMVDILCEEQEYDGDYYICLRLPDNIKEGDYYFGVRNRTLAWSGLLYLNSVEVTENNGGGLGIQVKREGKDELLEGVSVSLTGNTYETKTWQTDAEGLVAFHDLTPGSYTLSVVKEGFETKSITDIEVEAGKTDSLVIGLVLEPVSIVKGVVVDQASQPLSGAAVKITGKKTFECETAEDGTFLFPEVPINNDYKLVVSKELKLTYKKIISIKEDSEYLLDTLVLKDMLATPAKVYAENVEKGVFISWIIPVREKDFSLDNGVPGGTYQMNSKDYVYLGNTFREPMYINSISWALDESFPTVDVYIFPLNKDGSFSTAPIFSKLDVPSKSYDWDTEEGWSELLLDTPVVAPYGCVVSIGHDRSLTVLSDYQKLEGSVVCVDKDFSESGWFHSVVGNFFIRAGGVELTSDLNSEASKAIFRTASYSHKKEVKKLEDNSEKNFTFSIWRFRDKNDLSSWEIVTSGLKKLDYVDPSINNKGKGFYGYAVQAQYQDGRNSEYGYSELINHNMQTKVSVNVSTNTAVRLGDGVLVTLTNLDRGDLVYRAVTSQERAAFDNVLKGKYRITATKEGFTEASTDVVMDDQDEYSIKIELLLDALKPYNPLISYNDCQTPCILSWNNGEVLTEDFETMNDFEVNPQNSKGWTFVDVDSASTYGVALCKDTPYPNMYSPMAFMVFNPYKTTPNLSEYVRPKSGEKVLISVSPETGVRNNDYMFSPPLSFNSAFNLSFYAAAGFYGYLGNEEFMVGYSTSDPLPENVIYLTDTPNQVGGMWTPFSFTLPAEAKYAVIRCVSNQKLFFMLDDITLGISEPEIFNMASFNIILDGEELGTTYGRSMDLGKLDPGRHIAKIQAVYTMADLSKKYSDFTELQFTVKESTDIHSVNQEKLYTYNKTKEEIVFGDCVDAAALYDLEGRICKVAAKGQNILTGGYKGVYILQMVSSGKTKNCKIVL